MAFQARITLIDDYGRTMVHKVETVDATLVLATTHIGAYLTKLAAASDIGVAKCDYLSIDYPVAAPQAGANRDVGATLKATLDNGRHYPFKIPCIKPTLLNADGTVKIDDVAITDLIALFATGVYLRVSEGNWITGVLSGHLDK